MTKHVLVDRINGAFKEQHPERDKPFRAHLGGSVIGRKCERELYYTFRWFRRPTFDGRMLRLFQRGHREEFSFVAYLRSIGINVREYSKRLCLDLDMVALDPAKCPYILLPWEADFLSSGLKDVTGDDDHIVRAERAGVKVEQWRIADVLGHFGGSLDGLADAPYPIPITELIEGRGLVETGRFIPAGEEFLTEFKTHNTKSFSNLVTVGVKEAKPEHYAQMQVYMHKRNVRFAIYMAVNKNDDDLHVEVIEYDGSVGPLLIEKARKVIHSTAVPNRIGKHASWHECKFCDYKAICHNGDQSEIDRNCRTCVNSVPVDDGRWHCKQWNMLIPVDAMINGCDNHKIITD